MATGWDSEGSKVVSLRNRRKYDYLISAEGPAVSEFILNYRGPGFRIGKYLRLRGAGYETMSVGEQLEHDELDAKEIIDRLTQEECSVLGRAFDAAWYQQNARDVAILEAKAQDAKALGK